MSAERTAQPGEHAFRPAAGDIVLREGKPVAQNIPGSAGYTKWFPLVETLEPVPPAAGDVVSRGGVVVARAVPDALRGRRGFSWQPSNTN